MRAASTFSCAIYRDALSAKRIARRVGLPPPGGLVFRWQLLGPRLATLTGGGFRPGAPRRLAAGRRPCGRSLLDKAERVLGLLKNPLFGHFPGIASPALGLGCLPRGKSFGARADLFWHGGSGLLAPLVHPGRPAFNTLLRHN